MQTRNIELFPAPEENAAERALASVRSAAALEMRIEHASNLSCRRQQDARHARWIVRLTISIVEKTGSFAAPGDDFQRDPCDAPSSTAVDRIVRRLQFFDRRRRMLSYERKREPG